MKVNFKKNFLFLFIMIAAFSVISASGVHCSHGFYDDVAQITGTLDSTGKQLAYMSVVSNARKMGFTVTDKESADSICSNMSNPQYRYAVEKAADLVMNKTARTALKAGKMGQEVLTKLLNSASQAIDDTKKALQN